MLVMPWLPALFSACAALFSACAGGDGVVVAATLGRRSTMRGSASVSAGGSSRVRFGGRGGEGGEEGGSDAGSDAASDGVRGRR